MCAQFGKDAPHGTDDWLIPSDSRKYLEEFLKKLKDPVHVELFTQKGTNDEFNKFSRDFLRDLSRLAPGKVLIAEFGLDGKEAQALGIEESPTILLAPDKYSIRFTGAPAGEEGRSFIEALMLVSHGRSGLSQISRDILDELDEEREVKVFVSPTCPYCPGQVVNGVRAAIEKPKLVKFQYIDIAENPVLASLHNVGSVPHTVYGDKVHSLGLEPEERFIVQLTTLKSAEEWLREQGKSPIPAEAGLESEFRDLIIVGGGPAGLTAAIYGERSGLRCTVLEKKNVGGQVAITPVVENYPGFTAIPGAKLVDILSGHAREYVEIREFEQVREIKLGKFIEVTTDKALYRCRALIFAAGATWRKLGIPGEDRYYGRGVSHCTSCDGYLYKGKKVLVVGGGNTALTDALYLKNLGADVTIVHRRDTLRAEQRLQDSITREGIPVIWNSVVTKVNGDEFMTSAALKNQLDDTEQDFEADGLFIAIGEKSNSRLLREIGVATDNDGNIAVDRHMRTNIPRIYAAGDVTGGVRQIVTAVSEGAEAAMAAFEDLASMSEEVEDEE